MNEEKTSLKSNEDILALVKKMELELESLIHHTQYLNTYAIRKETANSFMTHITDMAFWVWDMLARKQEWEFLLTELSDEDERIGESKVRLSHLVDLLSKTWQTYVEKHQIKPAHLMAGHNNKVWIDQKIRECQEELEIVDLCGNNIAHYAAANSSFKVLNSINLYNNALIEQENNFGIKPSELYCDNDLAIMAEEIPSLKSEESVAHHESYGTKEYAIASGY